MAEIGIIVCDWRKAYSMYSHNLQKYLVHLLGKANGLSEGYSKFSYYYDNLRRSLHAN